MAAEVKKEIELEIAHVLFIDIVGYSELLINQRSKLLRELNEIVSVRRHRSIAHICAAQCQVGCGEGGSQNGSRAGKHQQLKIMLAIQQPAMQTGPYETPFDFCPQFVCRGAPILRGNSQAIGRCRWRSDQD
jgi:hypothetical protein